MPYTFVPNTSFCTQKGGDSTANFGTTVIVAQGGQGGTSNTPSVAQGGLFSVTGSGSAGAAGIGGNGGSGLWTYYGGGGGGAAYIDGGNGGRGGNADGAYGPGTIQNAGMPGGEPQSAGGGASGATGSGHGKGGGGTGFDPTVNAAAPAIGQGGPGGAGGADGNTNGVGGNYGGGGGGQSGSSSPLANGGDGAIKIAWGVTGFPNLPAGNQELLGAPGTYSWTPPAGVTTVHVALIGAGGGGGINGGSGGGGGGAGYVNFITVTPGTTYTLVVGLGGCGSPPTLYSYPDVGTVTKGGSFVITIAGSAPDVPYSYTITGVTSAEIAGAALTGTITKSSPITYTTVPGISAGTKTFTFTLDVNGSQSQVTLDDPATSSTTTTTAASTSTTSTSTTSTSTSTSTSTTTSTTSTTTSTSTSTSTTTAARFNPTFYVKDQKPVYDGVGNNVFAASYSLHNSLELEIKFGPPSTSFTITGTTPTGIFTPVTDTTSGIGYYLLPAMTITSHGVLDLTVTFTTGTWYGLTRRLRVYFNNKKFIARLRKNGPTGPILANSQVITVNTRGLAPFVNSDFANILNITGNVFSDENYIGYSVSNIAAPRPNGRDPSLKQFIVRLRRGSLSGPVVANSQIVTVMDLGYGGIRSTDILGEQLGFGVISEPSSAGFVTKQLTNTNFQLTPTTTTTSTSTTTSSTTTTSTSTTSTSTSTTSTTTSTSTSTTTTSTSSTSTTSTSSTTTTTSTSTSTSTTTVGPTSTTSTTTNLDGWAMTHDQISSAYIIGSRIYITVECNLPNALFYVTTDGTGTVTPTNQGPLYTDTTPTIPGGTRYLARTSFLTTGLGSLNVRLRIGSISASHILELNLQIILFSTTTSSTSTTTSTTTLALPTSTTTTTIAGPTTTTTSAAPFSSTTTSTSTSTTTTTIAPVYILLSPPVITGTLNPGGLLTMTSDALWDPSGPSTGTMWQRSPTADPILATWTDTGDIDNEYLVIITDVTYYFRLRKRSPNGLLTTYSNTIGPIVLPTTTTSTTTTTTTAAPTTSTTTAAGTTTSTTTSEFSFSRRKGGGGGGTGLTYGTTSGVGGLFGMGGGSGSTGGSSGQTSGLSNGGDGGLYGGGSGGTNTTLSSTTNFAGTPGGGAVRIITAGTVASQTTFVDFTTPGLQSWLCPAGVTSVSAICIGAGGKGWGGGGGGGGLGWKDNISVTPGSTYAVQVGAPGSNSGTVVADGGDSFFILDTTVCGRGGKSVAAGSDAGGLGGGYVGDNGGSGGDGSQSYGWGGGGGGAGGYTGNGGAGGQIGNSYTGYNGSGGGAGGGGGHSSVDSLP